ncbi:MAG: hypothetical protein ACHP8B_09240 [Terriglobales bacterium]
MLHQFSNDAPDDPIPPEAITRNKEDDALVQSWRDYDDVKQRAKAAKQSAKAVQEAEKEAEKQYADKCHTVWLRYKSQGKKNKGFHHKLKQLAIPMSRSTAYRVMGKYFPDDFPKAQPRKRRESRPKPEPTSCQGLTSETKSESSGLPAADAPPPTDLPGMLHWSDGAVKPLLEQVCAPLLVPARAALVRQLCNRIAGYVLPPEEACQIIIE